MAGSTESALAASLKKLLSKKTLDKITVRDITDDCGVNRQTFYYHFHDVYDLVEWILKSEAEKIAGDGITADNRLEVVMKMIREIQKERQFVLNLYYSLSHRELDQFMEMIIRPAIGTLAKEAAADMEVTDEDRELVVSILTSGLTGIMNDWIGTGLKEDVLMNLEGFIKMLDGTLVYFLKKFDRTPVRPRISTPDRTKPGE